MLLFYFILFQGGCSLLILINGMFFKKCKNKNVFVVLTSLSGCRSAAVSWQESVWMDADTMWRRGTPRPRPQNERVRGVRTSPGQDSASAPCRVRESWADCSRWKVTPETSGAYECTYPNNDTCKKQRIGFLNINTSCCLCSLTLLSFTEWAWTGASSTHWRQQWVSGVIRFTES